MYSRMMYLSITPQSLLLIEFMPTGAERNKDIDELLEANSPPHPHPTVPF